MELPHPTPPDPTRVKNLVFEKYASKLVKSGYCGLQGRVMTRWTKEKMEAWKAFHSTHPPMVAAKLPKPKAVPKIESERRAQIRVVMWLHDHGIPHYAIPNGANVTPHHRNTLLAEGMSPGIFDLCITRAKGKFHGLYIEMKREDGGAGLSAEQKRWKAVLLQEGYCAVQANGYNKAVEVLTWYLSLPDFSAS